MEVCPELHRILERLPHHHFPFDDALIPLNGIYVLFEDGEIAMTMSYSPYAAALGIEKGIYKDTVQTFVFDKGTSQI